jgi:Na+/proline symporter
LNITATIFLGGTLAAVIGGLFWRRASTLGGYFALILGAAGAVAFFFFHVSTSYAGLGSFLLAGVGMVGGSLLGRSQRE